jgi:hypothetical protein
MRSARDVGRIIGVLLPVHLATGLIVPYVLLHPLTTLPAGFLETAAGMSMQVRLNVLLLFLGGAVPVGIAVAAWPVVRQRGHALGLWLLALAAVNLSLQAIENGHWLSMLSLSQAYAAAGAADAGSFQSLAIVVRSAWKWAHYSHILVVVGWIIVLYSLIYRCALVPRALAAIGLVTAMLQVIGITLPVFLGYRMPFPELFGMPLGLAYLALALRLMARGFKEPQGTLRAEAHGVEVSGA